MSRSSLNSFSQSEWDTWFIGGTPAARAAAKSAAAKAAAKAKSKSAATKRRRDSFVNAFVNIYGAPPRTEVDASVAVDEAFGVEVAQSLEDGLSDILTEAGIASPRPDGTIGSHDVDVASDTESKQVSHQRLHLRVHNRPRSCSVFRWPVHVSWLRTQQR